MILVVDIQNHVKEYLLTSNDPIALLNTLEGHILGNIDEIDIGQNIILKIIPESKGDEPQEAPKILPLNSYVIIFDEYNERSLKATGDGITTKEGEEVKFFENDKGESYEHLDVGLDMDGIEAWIKDQNFTPSEATEFTYDGETRLINRFYDITDGVDDQL